MKPLLLICSLFYLAVACKTTQPQPSKPTEQYNALPAVDQISMINIPIRIALPELEKSLNTQLPNLLYEDKDIKDDNMMIRAEKRDYIKLAFNGKNISYRVPLKLWIQYDVGITNVEANGDIALQLKTTYNITEDWNMQTTTEIESYEWLQQPRLKMVGMNLPVGFIADLVLKNSKKTLTKAIDDAVGTNFNLQNEIKKVWEQLHEPQLIAPEYNTWLLVNPKNIGMTPLITRGDTIASTIVVETHPKVNIGNKPNKPATAPLPNFKYSNAAQDDFTLLISTDVPYQEAERLAKLNLAGQTFSEGKRSVKVEDVELYGQGNQLIVNTKLSGSYNGNIYLSGKPIFDPKKNAIDIKDLNFTLETRNFLYKSAAWLLKGTLKNQIEKNMDFLLDYNLTELKNQLQSQLKDYKITNSIILNGQLNELTLQDAFLAPESIRVQVALKGRLQVQVNGLN
ncbi:MAG: DUF4403 family protein [Saprospiraceae bacterium]